jgi:Bacterial PH domain
MKAVRRHRPASHSHGHRHTAPGQHEHDGEPQYGLPEALPEGEQVLWQGSPDWKTLAVQRFHVRKVAIYFALLLAARAAALVSDGMPIGAAVLGTGTLAFVAATALGLLSYIAWFTARTTVYTVTNRRVVMRIGIALTLALNLPFKRVQGAALAQFSGGKGDIALQLVGNDRIAFFHLWPHARRWHFAQPQPTLLCIPDAQAVAQVLTQAWSAAIGVPANPQPQAQAASTTAMAPSLATR